MDNMDPDAIEYITTQTSQLNVQESIPQPLPVLDYDAVSPPVQSIFSAGVIAVDITEHFVKAAGQLGAGELIKDEYFTLFESVGAIEIMDPKMDTGYLAADETMDDDYDIEKNLLPEEVMAIIDQLLCFEMAWHIGHPLSQTIFTSLYIDKLLTSPTREVEDIRFSDGTDSPVEESTPLMVLRAYCIGLIKTCWHVNDRVKAEHFYEEEDFVTHTYNRHLLDDVEDLRILNIIQSARDGLSSSESVASEVKKGLLARLAFRAAFLSTVCIASDRESSKLYESWTELLRLLPEVESGQEFSKPVPESFSVKLQRKLASTVPPRPVVTLEFQTAYEHLQRLCQDGQIITEVLKYHDSHSLMNFVSLFQARKPQPSVYIRTLLQHYIFGDMIVLGTMSIRQVLDDDLASIVLPEDKLLDPLNDEIEVPHDPRFNMAQRMEAFRGRAAQSYLDIIRTLCQNRCRIRRTLHHTIADWDNLQLDAEELDQQLQEFTEEKPTIDPSFSQTPIFSFPLSSWSYFYKLRQMEWIVQMGFELEVYQPDEIAGMYWYLQHLTQTRIRHLERIRGFVMKHFSAGRNRKSPSDRDLGFGRALSYINFSMLEATATQGLSDALSCLYVVLGRLSLLPVTPHPYSDDATRYELRMKPFLSIVLPEFIQYEHFHPAVTQPNESVESLLTFAVAAASRAKKDLELVSKLDAKTAGCQGTWCEDSWRKDVKECLKACISANITISVVKKAVDAAGKSSAVKLKVEILPIEKGYHDWWPIPKVTLIK